MYPPLIINKPAPLECQNRPNHYGNMEQHVKRSHPYMIYELTCVFSIYIQRMCIYIYIDHMFNKETMNIPTEVTK